MGVINQGSQTIVWDFRYPAKGKDFNRDKRDIIRPGIYRGLDLSFVGNSVFVSNGVAVLNCSFLGNDNLLVKIDFDSSFTYGVVYPSAIGYNEVLYIEYEYNEIIENYAEFKRESSLTFFSSSRKNAVILGELVFNSSNNIVNIDLSNRTYGLISADADWTVPDKTVYHNVTNKNKRFRIDGSLLPVGLRDIQVPNFNESSARLLVTNSTNTTVVENNISIDNDANVNNNLQVNNNANVNNDLLVGNSIQANNNVTVGNNLNVNNRIIVGKFDGRVPLGGVIAVVGTRNMANNGGYGILPPNIPPSGVINDDGFQLCDGALVGVGGILTGYVPNITDDRFIQGSSSLGIIGGNYNNMKWLSIDELPQHNHEGSLGYGGWHDHSIGLGRVGWAAFNVTFVINFNEPRDHRTATGNMPPDSPINYTGWHGGHTHDGILGHSGGGQPFDIRPKFISAIYLMRVR